jgi:hypothetical protein
MIHVNLLILIGFSLLLINMIQLLQRKIIKILLAIFIICIEEYIGHIIYMLPIDKKYKIKNKRYYLQT